MDIYEALKNGTSAEELLQAFHEDLDKANARILAEQQAKIDNQRLTDCREDLAIAILDYAEAFLGEKLDEETWSVDSLTKTLIEFEKEMEQTMNLTKKLKKALEKAKGTDKTPVGVKVTTRTIGDNEDDIIAKFIKSLT